MSNGQQFEPIGDPHAGVVGYIVDPELVRQCAASGQMEASEIVAHGPVGLPQMSFQDPATPELDAVLAHPKACAASQGVACLGERELSKLFQLMKADPRTAGFSEMNWFTAGASIALLHAQL
jgi:hypothetical protein